MNHLDSCLARLLNAATRAPRELPTEAPFAAEARLLAAWRSAPDEDRSLLLAPLFRGAFICACAIILITAALSLRSLTEAPPNEMIIVDSVIQLTLMQ